MDEYVLVGKTKKAHGVKGGVKLAIKDQFVEDVLNVEVAFLKVQGKLLPYFVETFDYTNSLIVKFEDIDSPEAAIPITSKDFFIRAKDIQQQSAVTFREGDLEYGKLLGFTIHDAKQGLIGKIIEIFEFPQQEMAQVSYQSKEIFIPLNQQLIQSVDQKKEQVLMNLPEGLLDL